MLHTLENAPGARKKRKRVGRGPGSTLGKTCGRGHKGQNSRSGSKRRIGFEGGQMPLHRRLPKRGFKSLFRQEYSIVNLSAIMASPKVDKNEKINLESLKGAGLVRNLKLPLKVLGDQTVDLSLNIEATKFSASAKEKILAAGGTATVING
ncbi:MAG: 50S ribosomal protein L15 [SAR324 cluster bacterium]|uniref:Large ribosomal subunit protein uL15 n=1 Tax=SAR324 cluster bacterium TaxID=2024889 RepID=A0A2A4TAG9_9DELT|nr:MAG: 50S ribosomal protein L15 [SAR324 cluster bacterium]